MREARLKEGLAHVVSWSLMIQSMLGFNQPVMPASVALTLLRNFPALRVLPYSLLHTNHLPTELYRTYGYEFIVTDGQDVLDGQIVLPEERHDKRRIYFSVERTQSQLIYVVDSRSSWTAKLLSPLYRQGQWITHGTLPISNIGASLRDVDSLGKLAPHLPKIMLALSKINNTGVFYLHPQSAALARQLLIGICVFLMLGFSVSSIKKDPINNSIGLLAKLFLWCSTDIDIPQKLFETVLKQPSQFTEVCVAQDQALVLGGLNCLSNEMLLCMVLFKAVFNSRERIQNGLVTAGIIENPRVRIEEARVRIEDDLANMPVLVDMPVVVVGQEPSPNHLFYLTAGMVIFAGVGALGGVACLLALSGLIALSTNGVLAASAAAAIGVTGGVGFFCARNYPATLGAAREAVGEMFNGGRLEMWRHGGELQYRLGLGQAGI